MICTMRCCKWIVNSLRSMCYKELYFLHIPPNLNKTSTIAKHAPTQYYSDIYN